MERQNLQRRLRPLYTAQFLQGFVLWYAIEKVFMRSIGLSNAQIAVETVMFTAVMLVANIPLGMLADRWSRKGVLVFAGVALIASSIVSGLSNSFWQYVAGGALWGLFYAAYAGTYDSITYDTVLEETGKTDSYEHFYGRVQLFDSIALVAGSLLSTVVVHVWGLRANYFITVIPSALSIFALAKFNEPTLHRKETTGVVSAHLKTTFKVIAKRGRVMWIVLSMVTLGATMRIMLELDQLWLLAVALPVGLYGPINALILSGFAAAGPIASRAKRSPLYIALVGFALCAAGVALVFHNRLLIIVAEIVIVVTMIALNIILGKLLHDTMPSNVRAGASSIVSTMGYLLFLPIGILFGEVSTRVSVFRAAWIVVALAFATFASLLVVLKAKQAPSTEASEQA